MLPATLSPATLFFRIWFFAGFFESLRSKAPPRRLSRQANFSPQRKQNDQRGLMKYSPNDVRHQEFPGGMGGYKRLEVRTFLSELADDLEELLLSRQELNERLQTLEGRVTEYRTSESDLHRAVVSAERIAQEVRENARREAELITSRAETQAAAMESSHEARQSELESLHRSRSSEVEATFRARFSDLEAQYHSRHRELEQGLSTRTAFLESVFSQRHTELSNLLSRVRGEQAQFVAQYRALVGSFHELAGRHPLPELLPLPTEAPPPSNTANTLPYTQPLPAQAYVAQTTAVQDDPEGSDAVSAVGEQQFV
jgi:cell division initiation protein